MSKPKCYNCGKKGHFARDYKKLKKVNDLYALVSAIDVSSSVFIESDHLWTTDSKSMDHVWIPKGTKWIYVGNNLRAEVKGIDTCKLVM